MKISRKELIKNTISLRVLKKDNNLFVNIYVGYKAYSFTSTIEHLDYELEKEALKSICVLSKIIISGKEIDTEAFVTKLEIKNGVFIALFSDGKKLECRSKDFDFEAIEPTNDELKTLILENIEEF